MKDKPAGSFPFTASKNVFKVRGRQKNSNSSADFSIGDIKQLGLLEQGGGGGSVRTSHEKIFVNEL